MGSLTTPIKSNQLSADVSTFKNTTTLTRLNDPRKFKATKRLPVACLKIVSKNLSNVIGDCYLLVRKRINNKTVKTYIFLVFKDFTNLEHVCNIVHKSVPYIEIDNRCKNPCCTCSTCSLKIEKGRKRRGFGYISESDIQGTINHLQSIGFSSEIKKLPATKCTTKTIRNPGQHFECVTCNFICKTKLGYFSHTSKHKHENIKQ